MKLLSRIISVNICQKRKLLHNCAGKHLGFLAYAREKGYDMGSYDAPDHPLQLAIKKAGQRAIGNRSVGNAFRYGWLWGPRTCRAAEKYGCFLFEIC
ncbi:asparaginase [Virgibacillus halophilus]|uniref:Asparaginase n=1 Tax=Tigheibacillus halophilus TaxID=361280 RepID=A0ABU5C3G8_9BACI|nr:asparaginase [Virgibacillus halophilus]